MQDYYESNPENNLFQGDIISGVPFIDPISKNFLDSQLSNDEDDKVQFRATARIRNAILVSQTCDVERALTDKVRENVLVAPVITITDYEKSMQSGGIKTEKIQSYLSSIRGQKTKYLFYLPSNTYIEESFADLTLITYLDASFLKISSRLVSLSHYGRSWFSYTLSEYLDRPFK